MYLKQVFKSIALLKPWPLDARSVVETLVDLNTSLPESIRYQGHVLYDELTSRSYLFRAGVTDANLQQIALIKRITIEDPIDLTGGDTYTLNHDLNLDFPICKFYLGNDEIPGLVIMPTIDGDDVTTADDVFRAANFDIDFSEWKTETALTTMPAGLTIVITY